MERQWHSLLWIVFLPAALICAQQTVRYTISFPNAAHHEAQVSVEFSGIKEQPLQLMMSRSSPGRYALHEFVKNVYNLQVFGAKGQKLPLSCPDVYSWRVDNPGDYVKVSYTIFGDHCDGTYLAIDNSHAHLNMPAAFLWAPGLENQPIEIRFEVPDKKWRVATQLEATSDPYVFSAPNLDYFMDSPTELSALQWREWTMDFAGATPVIRLAIHHLEDENLLQAIEQAARAFINEQARIFGELPDFDYGSYTFIGCFLLWADRDAMEHRNSTIVTYPQPLSQRYIDILAAMAHEFFHVWNVERLRPKSLQPFDFTRANMSGELWFAEGFTNYYELISMTRAGLYNSDRFARHLSRVLNQVLTMPGLTVNNAQQMSQYAPFVDAGRSIDAKNLSNTFISYYTLGEAIALGLDLSIRQKFPGKSLDDLMRAAWQKFGKKEIPYTNNDLQQLLADVTGDSTFATAFFEKHINGHSLPDYDRLLAPGGFILEREKADSAWVGFSDIIFKDGKMIIANETFRDQPLYLAGLDRGDTIRSIAGESPATADAWQSWLAGRKPGETVDISYDSRGSNKKARLTLQGNPELTIRPLEHETDEIPAEVKAFRKSWLGLEQGSNPYNLKRFCPQCNRAFPFSLEYCAYDGEKLQLIKQ